MSVSFLKRKELLDRSCWEAALDKMLFKIFQNGHKKSEILNRQRLKNLWPVAVSSLCQKKEAFL